MFEKVVETAKILQPKLKDGWIYRGEYLQKPKHNALAYNRVPNMNIIIFDIMTGPEIYLSPYAKARECANIGLECVPVLYQELTQNFEQFKSFLEKESILGGTTIEGFVVKNYNLFTQEKKVAMGKYVSEAYKEVQSAEWKKSDPIGKDIIGELIIKLRTEARWNKAVQHLRDNGNLDGSPKDIGNLLKEVQRDILKECGDEIKDVLFKHYWKNIARGVVAGLPEWWKDKLAKDSFSSQDNEKLPPFYELDNPRIGDD